MPILNYTTSIDAGKTAAEVVAILAKGGAKHVGMEYENGRPVGVRFAVQTAYGPRDFELPVNFDGVYKALCRDAEPRYRNRDQAFRVAWRITKDWIEAQMAMVQAGITQLDQVMFPYMLADSGRPVYEVYASSQPALTAGSNG